MPGLNIYFGILLLLISLVMAGITAMTCTQVFRLRNKRMSWRAGTLKGFPLFSTIFLGVSLTFVAIMWNQGVGWEIAASSLYLVISGCWFVSSYYSSKCYITDHGIVKNVNDPAQTVAWHQIHDFFERHDKDNQTYIFIYRENNYEPIKKVVRLQLKVPDKYNPEFKKLISHKLGRRISCYDESIDAAQFK